MNASRLFLPLCVAALAAPAVRAQLLFSQDFSSSSLLSDYVSSTPSTGQFNGITAGSGNTATINSGSLQVTRATGGGNAAVWRTTDLAPTPSALLFQFDLNVTGNSVAQTGTGLSGGVSLYFGQGLTGGVSTTSDTSSNLVDRINIGWTSTDGQWDLLRGGTSGASALQTGPQTVRWYINNDATATSYTAPDTSTHTLATGTYDVWIGSSIVFTAVASTGTGTTLADFKFRWDSGAQSATISFDNVSMSAIPEPSTYAACVGMAALAYAGWRRRRLKSTTGA